MVACFINCGPRLLWDAWLASMFFHCAAVFTFLVVSLKHKLWSIDVHLLLTGVIPWRSVSCLRHSLLAKPRLFFCLQFDTFNFCIWVFDRCWVNYCSVYCRVHVEARGQFVEPVVSTRRESGVELRFSVMHGLYLPSRLTKLRVNFCRKLRQGFPLLSFL